MDECSQYGVPIKEFMIKEAALLIAKELNLPNFRASNGWFRNLKAKNLLKLHKIQGDMKSSDFEATQELKPKGMKKAKDRLTILFGARLILISYHVKIVDYVNGYVINFFNWHCQLICE